MSYQKCIGLVLFTALAGIYLLVPGVRVESIRGASPNPSPTSRPPKAGPSPRLAVQPAQDCAREPDKDGDSHKSIRCGGDDCNDNDKERYPSVNTEVCSDKLFSGASSAEHDEDCNPATVNADPSSYLDGDKDGDGFPSYKCSNPLEGPTPEVYNQYRIRFIGQKAYGLDCDDENAAIKPGSMSCINETTVQLCVQAGTFEDSIELLSLPRNIARGAVPGTIRVPCPPSTRCIAQPNGTGVCSR